MLWRASWPGRQHILNYLFSALPHIHMQPVQPVGDNPPREARQTAAGAIWETRHWRNVRTAQDSVAANGCPP